MFWNEREASQNWTGLKWLCPEPLAAAGASGLYQMSNPCWLSLEAKTVAEHSSTGSLSYMKRGLSCPDCYSGCQLSQRTGRAPEILLYNLIYHRSRPVLTYLRVSMFDRVSVLVMVNCPVATSRWHQGCSGGQTCARLDFRLGAQFVTSAVGFAFLPQYSAGCQLDLARWGSDQFYPGFYC